MLCQFNFTNFRSYKDEATIDMQATSSGAFADSLIYRENDSGAFLPVSAIFGANAGGKSNAIKALNCMIGLVTTPIKAITNTPIREKTSCVPFEFDQTSRNDPTVFEIFFREKSGNDGSETEYEYRYIISILNNVIQYESLQRKKISKKSRLTLIFERDHDAEEISIGPCIRRGVKGKVKTTDIKDNMPYLTVLTLTYNLEPINTAMNFFGKCVYVNYGIPAYEDYVIFSDNANFRHAIVDLMNNMGINISDIKTEKSEDDDKKFRIVFDHTVNGNVYELDISKESNGTQKLFNVLPYVYNALNDGNLLIIDELDAKLHPLLLRHLIMLFKDKGINKKGAQLIFTTHDVSIMRSSVLRTDEIWFACKKDDESSDLYSLSELRDENNNKISPNTAYDKQYLEGRYGADPIFGGMMEWK